MLAIHCVAALPAERVLGFDHRAALSTLLKPRLRFLWRRSRCGRGPGFFMLDDRWWLDHRRYWSLLRLLPDHVEQSGSSQCPSISGAGQQSRLNDLHLTSFRMRTVIIV